MKNSICKVPEKSIDLINETFYCKLSQTHKENNLKALLTEGRPGKDVSKHEDRTGNLGSSVSVRHEDIAQEFQI